MSTRRSMRTASGRAGLGPILGLAALATALGWHAPAAAQRNTAGTARNLECRDIRRLSDNYLLDLRVRLIFSWDRRAYVRLENTGRGWQYIAQRPYVAVDATRIVLADDGLTSAYIERLTGDYYHIDLTGTALSVWGRCALVGGTDRLF